MGGHADKISWRARNICVSGHLEIENNDNTSFKPEADRNNVSFWAIEEKREWEGSEDPGHSAAPQEEKLFCVKEKPAKAAQLEREQSDKAAIQP